MSAFRTAIRIAGFGAAAYTGWAAFSWFRYGRVERSIGRSRLDAFMPDPEVAERHSIDINAPAAIAYDACRKFDMMRSPAARLLFETRAILMCGESPDENVPADLIGQVTAIGWEILYEQPGHEFIFGAAAKPWIADAGFRAIPPGEFAAFDEPGWAKIVWNMAVTPTPEGCRVSTETRVSTTDAEARKLFRRYWAMASPGIKVIRLVSLRTIKRMAEAKVPALAPA
jgi:hypothetical protein